MKNEPRGAFTTNELPRKVDFFTTTKAVSHCDAAACLWVLLKSRCPSIMIHVPVKETSKQTKPGKTKAKSKQNRK